MYAAGVHVAEENYRIRQEYVGLRILVRQCANFLNRQFGGCGRK